MYKRFASRLKETLTVAGFAFLAFECLMAVLAVAGFADGLLMCQTVAGIIRFLLPRILGIAFYSALFCTGLQMIWNGRHLPEVNQMLLAIAVIGIPGWIPGQLEWIMRQLGC